MYLLTMGWSLAHTSLAITPEQTATAKKALQASMGADMAAAPRCIDTEVVKHRLAQSTPLGGDCTLACSWALGQRCCPAGQEH